MVSADDYGIDYTGATDVRAALTSAINAQSSGTTFYLHSGGFYLLTYDTPLILAAPGVTVDGLGATLFRNQRRTQITGTPTQDIMHISASNMTLRNLRIFGFRKDTYNGNVLTTVTGSPTVVGTTVELNAQSEEVRCPKIGLDINSADNTLPPNGVSNTPHPHTNFETPYYFRQIDGLLKFEAVLSSNNPVANDAVFSIIDDETDAVIYSQSYTLTPSPTTKTITFDPGTTYLGRPMRVTIRKSTATANVITVGSITPYGEIGYRDKDASDPYGIFTGGNEFSDALQINSPISNTVLEYLDIEGPDGDGINCAAIDTNTIIRHCNVRGCGRQAYTIHQSINPLIEDCTAREVGRSGVDFEPNVVTHLMTDGIVQRCTFENIRNYTMSGAHWAKILDFTISDITSIRSGMGAFRGGGRNLTMTDYYHGETYRTEADRVANGGHAGADADLMGINMEVTNFTCQLGIWLTAITNNYNDGGGIVAYVPDDIHVHEAVVLEPYTDPYVFIDATNSTVDLADTGLTNAFQTSEGLFVTAVPELFEFTFSASFPLFVEPGGPSDVEEAFQQDTFQDDAFQQAAASDGISHAPLLFAPTLDAISNAQFVYLTGGAGWDSDEVLWDTPDHVWDEGNVGGIVLEVPQLFTPTVYESVTVPLLDAVPTLFTPNVSPKDITAPLLDAVGFLIEPVVYLIVYQADTIDMTPQLFEFGIVGPIEPDLIDASPEVYTPNVDAKYVNPGLINATPAVFEPTKVTQNVTCGLIDHTPECYTPIVGPYISPIEMIDATPVVYTPSLERIFVDLIDVSPEVFEPQKVNLPFHVIIDLEDDGIIIDATPEVFEPVSIDKGQPKVVFAEFIDGTPLVMGPHVITTTRPTIILRARYDPLTGLHARYDPVTLKHAQNSRQGS